MPPPPPNDESAEPPRSLWRFLFGLVWQYRGGCLRVLSIQLVLVALGLSGLGLVGVGVDFIRYRIGASAAPKPPHWPLGWGPPTTWGDLTVLGVVGGAILIFAFVRAALNFLYAVDVARVVQLGIVVDLRARVYDKLQRLSFRFFDANTTGAIINRVTGDVQAVRQFVDGVVIQGVILFLTLAAYTVYMLRMHRGLTAACLAFTPALAWVTLRFSRRVQPAYRVSRERFDRLIQRLSENLQGAHVVKGFAREEEEVRRFNKANEEFRDQRRWIFRQVSRFQPSIGFLTQLNLVVLIAFGGWLVVQYERSPSAESAAAVGLSVGQLIVFAGLLQQFAGQVANIANIANSLQESLASARRVQEVLRLPIEIQSPPDAIPLPRAKGRVTFEDVTFGYDPRTPALRHVSFDAPPGARVAILGPTGSGKSTLLSLIPRFYDPQRGRVLVDGVDIRRYALDDLRRNIGMVFQESFLFSSTIADNIAFGKPDAPREQVEWAARIAAAHDFIVALPEGYDTVLREGGANLSGGQRQRIAIARAILLDPPILLFDDPTASVDPHTEEEILEAMARAMTGRTTLVVAHRLSTLRGADLVLVLDRGRVVQRGTHEELLRVPGPYREAVAAQGGIPLPAGGEERGT
jgi:ATP-binding cassette subfamily B protein